MSLKAMMDAKKAYNLQSKGNIAEAMEMYQKSIDEGLDDASSILRYTVLLIRAGEFAKARELLVKIQKYPMAEENRNVLLCNYATCVYKMGELEKGIKVLEGRHEKFPCGLVYDTLGYLYVLAGDFEKALAYNTQALEYDDEDPITLDNMGQTWYLLGNDKARAKEYFDKAIALKPGQIDTLWFLSRYDLEAGDKAAALEKLEEAVDGRFSPLNHASREMIQEEIEKLKA